MITCSLRHCDSLSHNSHTRLFFCYCFYLNKTRVVYYYYSKSYRLITATTIAGFFVVSLANAVILSCFGTKHDTKHLFARVRRRFIKKATVWIAFGVNTGLDARVWLNLQWTKRREQNGRNECIDLYVAISFTAGLKLQNSVIHTIALRRTAVVDWPRDRSRGKSGGGLEEIQGKKWDSCKMKMSFIETQVL